MIAKLLDAIRKIACKLCGSAVVQAPDTSINILSGSDITSEELYGILSNYTKNVYIRDSKYHTINLPKFWEYLKINPVSKRKYVPERFDCDDSSFELFYSTYHSYPSAAIGIVWGVPRSEGIKGHHAWNFIVTSDKKVMWVEPQNDGVWAPGKDDEVSMMLI